MRPITSISKILFATTIFTAACGNQDTPQKVRGEPKRTFPISQTRDKVSHTNVNAPSVPPVPIVEPVVEPVPTPVEQIRAAPAVPVETRALGFGGLMTEGRAQMSSGNFDSALDLFSDAVAKRPKSAMAHIQMARTHLEMKSLPSAREHVEKALESNRGSSFAWNTLGRIERADSNLQAAITAFERAVQENRDNSYAWNNLGLVYMEQESYEEAAYALEQATSGTSPAEYMWNNLGMTYEHLEQREEAKAAYRQAIELGSAKAQTNLERLDQ